ncbi:MAG TPA: sulfatase-like hydrolase/transferase, partial [Nannocystis sp.]
AGYRARDYAGDPRFNDYLNTVAYTDRFIGKLHAGLFERGLLENTIFVVIGDHGEAFGEHGRTQHDNVIWEEGLRVPLILSGPGVGPPGRVVEGLFQSIDVAPTIARLVGLPAPPAWVGVDLLESAGHERLFFSCWHDDTCMAMREGARKAIYHYGEPETVVHDVVADPLETEDMSHEGDHAAFAEAAVEAMFQWRTATNGRYAGL